MKRGHILGIVAALALIYFWPPSAKDAELVVLGFPHDNVRFESPKHVVTHSGGVDFISADGNEVHFVGSYRVEYYLKR